MLAALTHIFTFKQALEPGVLSKSYILTPAQCLLHNIYHLCWVLAHSLSEARYHTYIIKLFLNHFSLTIQVATKLLVCGQGVTHPQTTPVTVANVQRNRNIDVLCAVVTEVGLRQNSVRVAGGLRTDLVGVKTLVF